MNKLDEHKQVENAERKTMTSYVIGFVMSLIATFIPYYLVVNQTITGTTLLFVILGFAVLQMLIQIVFFLHLGRGPKPLYNVVFFISTVGIILVVVGGSIVIINNLHYNKKPSDQVKVLVEGEGIYQVGGQKTGACQGQYDNHVVTFKSGVAIPNITKANKCDTLTFINSDTEPKAITFGTFPEREAFAGENEYIVRNGRNKTITLSETGDYRFYDQANPGSSGYFTVLE